MPVPSTETPRPRLNLPGHLNAEPSSPFFLCHHPDAWEVVTEGLEAPTWVPALTVHPIAPGVNGMRIQRQDEPAQDAPYAQAVSARRELGWTYLDEGTPIPKDCWPEGVSRDPAAPGYLRPHRVHHRATGITGTRYEEVWNVPLPQRAGRPARFVYDRAAFNRWRVYLVTSGQIPAPEDWRLREIAAQMNRRLEDAEVLRVEPAVRKEIIARKKSEVDPYRKATVPSAEAA